jgi:outer membrane lipoprotein LolB
VASIPGQRASASPAQLLLLLLALSSVFQGCRTPPERLPDGASQLAWEQRIARLSGWAHWAFNGRVAIRHGDEGWQSGLNWRQDGDYFEIQVLDPLGRKVADIRGDSRGVHLTTSRGGNAQAADPESLMRQVLGWSLPLSGMRYWVLGVPDPGSGENSLQLDQAGRLVHLAQGGWDVSYRRYSPVSPLDMPARMTFSNRDLDIKLIVSDWELENPARLASRK